MFPCLPVSLSTCFLRLLRQLHRPRLPHHGHLDLPWILQVVFDLLSDVLGQTDGRQIVDVVGPHDHPHLAAGLDRVGLLDPGEGAADLFQIVQPLDVRLQPRPPRPRPPVAELVRRIDDVRKLGIAKLLDAGVIYTLNADDDLFLDRWAPGVLHQLRHGFPGFEND